MRIITFLTVAVIMVFFCVFSDAMEKECRDECRRKATAEEMRQCLKECAGKPAVPAPAAESVSDPVPKKVNVEDITSWKKVYKHDKVESASVIRRRPGGGYVICGQSAQIRHGVGGIFLLDISKYGEEETFSTLHFGDHTWGRCNAVSPLSNGEYLVASTVLETQGGNLNAVVARLTRLGESEWQWERSEEGKNNYAGAVQATDDGGIVIGGFAD